MFHILKELYWLRSSHEPRLDRHRYWLAVYLLLLLQYGSIMVNALIVIFYNNINTATGPEWILDIYLAPQMLEGLVVMLLHLLVGINAFGRFYGVLAGIGTYSLGVLGRLLLALANSYDPSRLIGHTTFVLLGLAAIGILALAMGCKLRPLRDIAPEHALLRKRETLPYVKQLDCIEFLGRFLRAQLVLLIVAVLLAWPFSWSLDHPDKIAKMLTSDKFHFWLRTAGIIMVIGGLWWIKRLVVYLDEIKKGGLALCYCLLTLLIGVAVAVAVRLMVWSSTRTNHSFYISYADATQYTLMAGGFCLLLLTFGGAIWLTVLIAKRLNTLTNVAIPIVLGGLALMAVIAFGSLFLAKHDFYDNAWLYVLAKSAITNLVIASIGAQIYLITQPAAKPSKDKAEKPTLEPQPTAAADT
ncbi:hypothetical protein [Vreelandella sp. GE22]